MAQRKGYHGAWVAATVVLGASTLIGWWWRSRYPCAHFVNRAAGIPKQYQDIAVVVFPLNGTHAAYAIDANGEQVASSVQPSSIEAVRTLMPAVLQLQRPAPLEGSGG